MIKVDARVQVYKDHGNDVRQSELLVKSSWINSDRVVLVYGDMEIEIVANDLHAALNAATTTGRSW